MASVPTWPYVLPVLAVLLLVLVGIFQVMAVSGVSCFHLSATAAYNVQIGLFKVERAVCEGEVCLRDSTPLSRLRPLSTEFEGFDEGGTRAAYFAWSSLAALSLLTFVSVGRLVANSHNVRLITVQALLFIVSFTMILGILFSYGSNAHGFSNPTAVPFLNPGHLLNFTQASSISQSFSTHFALVVAALLLQAIAGVFLFVRIVPGDSLFAGGTAATGLNAATNNSNNNSSDHSEGPLISTHASIVCPNCALHMIGNPGATVLCPGCAQPLRVPLSAGVVRLYRAMQGVHSANSPQFLSAFSETDRFGSDDSPAGGRSRAYTWTSSEFEMPVL